MLPVYLIFYCVVGLHFMNIYSIMPASIPVHFNIDGEPDKWMDAQKFAKLHLLFVFSMSGIFAFTAVLVKKLPHQYLHIPNKAYWLAPERAQATVESLVDSLTWMGIIAGTFVIVVDDGIVRAAVKNARSMDMNTVRNTALVCTGLIGIIVARLMMKFRQPPPPKK